MSTEMQTKVQVSPARNFMPAQTSLLQRQCTLCNTPGLVDDSKQDKEKLTLQRSSADQAGTTTVPRFGHDFSRVRVHSTGPGMIQTKLKINEPGDIYEQEADRVADAVMRMPEPQVQREVEPEEEEEEERLQTKPLTSQITPLVQVQRQEEPEEETLQSKPLVYQITPLVQRQEEPPEEEEKPLQAKFKDVEMLQCMYPESEEGLSQKQPMEEGEELQAKSKFHETLKVTPMLESRINSLKGSGQPLPPKQRVFYESRIGHDFKGVRIHVGAQAADTAQAIQAKAFTLGKNIVFNTGQYSPNNQEGKKLLAHELIHVVQQSQVLTKQATPEVNLAPVSKRQRKSKRNITPLTQLEKDLIAMVQNILANNLESVQNIDWINHLSRDLQYQIDGAYAKSIQKRRIRRQLRKVARKYFNKHIKGRWRQYWVIKQRARQHGISLRGKISEKERRRLIKTPRYVQDSQILSRQMLYTPLMGRIASRLDFQTVFKRVLGSVDKVKTHFKNIRRTNIEGNPPLHKDAKARVEKAAQAFGKHRFPKSKVGQQLRAIHLRKRKHRSKFGHPLGFSLDFYPYENPFIDNSDLALLLHVTSGGPTHMALRDLSGQEYGFHRRRQIIAEIGRKTLRRIKYNKIEKHLLNQIRNSYSQFSKASKRFQKLVTPANQKQLIEIAQFFWKERMQFLRAKWGLKTKNKQIPRARKRAIHFVHRSFRIKMKNLSRSIRNAWHAERKRLKISIQQYRKDPSRYEPLIRKSPRLIKLLKKAEKLKQIRQSKLSDIDKHPLVRGLIKQRKKFLNRLAPYRQVQKKFEKLIQPLTAKIDARIRLLKIKKAKLESRKFPSKRTLLNLRRRLRNVRYSINKKHSFGYLKKRFLRASRQFVMTFGSQKVGHNPIPQQTPKGRKQLRNARKGILKVTNAMLKKIKSVQKKRNELRILTKQKNRLVKLRYKLLNNLYFFFGKGKKTRSGKHILRKTTQNPPVMMILQFGFARNDPMTTSSPSTSAQQAARSKQSQLVSKRVFNWRFIKTMIRFGFDSGASWRKPTDTMHFDYIEGFKRIRR